MLSGVALTATIPIDNTTASVDGARAVFRSHAPTAAVTMQPQNAIIANRGVTPTSHSRQTLISHSAPANVRISAPVRRALPTVREPPTTNDQPLTNYHLA